MTALEELVHAISSGLVKPSLRSFVVLSQSISSILWAFATLSIQDAALLECSAGQALQFLDSFNPQARLQMSLKPAFAPRDAIHRQPGLSAGSAVPPAHRAV